MAHILSRTLKLVSSALLVNFTEISVRHTTEIAVKLTSKAEDTSLNKVHTYLIRNPVIIRMDPMFEKKKL